MAHIFDFEEGGFRLVCEATGTLSPVVATEEQAVLGVEWYSDVPGGDRLYIARQRARFKERMVNGLGLGPEEAEDHAAALRWDLMANGVPARALPTKEQFAEAEAPFPELAQRARVGIAVQNATFAADGVAQAVLTFTGLVAATEVIVTGPSGELKATVSPADPVLGLTSDVPSLFSVRVLDAVHWSRPVEIEAA